MKFLKGAFCGALAMLLIMGVASCNVNLKNGGKETQALGSETEKKLKVLEELIEQSYLGEVDEKELQSGIYEGYISGLEDPYSVYYDEKATKSLMESTSGEYDGVGAVMTQNRETGIITFSQVYENSPAEKAGIKDGDILYKVEGKDISGRDLAEVVGDIKGERGTEVSLTVLRGNDAKEMTFTAVRETIEYPTVSSKMLKDNLGYLRILEFDDVTYEQYKEAFEELEEQGMQGLIVDLRSNPGGGLGTVCDILDEILPEGLIVYMEDKSGKKQEAASDEEHKLEIPLTVLVNENSASASEIFAGAIQDYGLGKIVGKKTYGKGVVQQIFDLKDGTCVKLTISEYFTPKGRSINEKGIVPDVEVAYEADEKNPEADNQLDKAVEVLKEELGRS